MSGGPRRDDRGGGGGGAPPVSMDIQKRTLKVNELDDEVSKELLEELFLQAGPVTRVVRRNDFAFIEFDDEESVGYALAMMDKVQLFGKELVLSPKINSQSSYKYVDDLNNYENEFGNNPNNWWQKFGDPKKPVPSRICSYKVAPARQSRHSYFQDRRMPHNHQSHPQPVLYPNMAPVAVPMNNYFHPPASSLPNYPSFQQPPFPVHDYDRRDNFHPQPYHHQHNYDAPSRRGGRRDFNRPHDHHHRDKPPYYRPPNRPNYH